jgi:hypothetical protein
MPTALKTTHHVLCVENPDIVEGCAVAVPAEHVHPLAHRTRSMDRPRARPFLVGGWAHLRPCHGVCAGEAESLFRRGLVMCSTPGNTVLGSACSNVAPRRKLVSNAIATE